MRIVIAKSLFTGLLSLLASLALSFAFVPMLGGEVAGAGLVMTIVCPLAISIPASAVLFSQSERIRRAEAMASDALMKLAAAYEELHCQSRRDGLTELLNRSAFMEELQTFSREGVAGALIFLDLDHFKSINDRYGHATGDEVLRRTGQILATYRGQLNIAGRLGGEEFALFQGGLTVDEMLRWCEDIRELIEGMDVRSASRSSVPVSASIGAIHCAPGFDPHGGLRAADINLYEAKSLGRNRVVSSI
ncbi:GGDEF domain-containing protein [Neorhizobium galegae]|uniref:GGDEF domain-containing protein n=1 Tax=Neorhizobium galegae TaxID=399 RepID=UPI000622645D|nr:GGDEF domain-containing protein [Neorhizobium galegae]CDZ48226.1 GGDEF domain-containing protein [Neorhizobium galegae bv. orientalis]